MDDELYEQMQKELFNANSYNQFNAIVLRYPEHLKQRFIYNTIYDGITNGNIYDVLSNIIIETNLMDLLSASFFHSLDILEKVLGNDFDSGIDGEIDLFDLIKGINIPIKIHKIILTILMPSLVCIFSLAIYYRIINEKIFFDFLNSLSIQNIPIIDSNKAEYNC